MMSYLGDDSFNLLNLLFFLLVFHRILIYRNVFETEKQTREQSNYHVFNAIFINPS